MLTSTSIKRSESGVCARKIKKSSQGFAVFTIPLVCLLDSVSLRSASNVVIAFEMMELQSNRCSHIMKRAAAVVAHHNGSDHNNLFGRLSWLNAILLARAAPTTDPAR